MNKNMRTWVIGICVALVIIVAVAAAFANNRSGSDAGQTSESQTESASASAASQTETETGSGEQASSNSGNAADHSGHNGHMNASGDDLSRYLTEQDSIMMNMMEDMVIREKSGNASLDFLRGMIPHHEAAIKMSESYLNYQGKSDELKTIAQDIITAQKDELKQMNELVKTYETGGKKDQTKEDAYLEQYSKMFADDSMSHHMDTSDVDSLDQAFAEGMIMHHQMAVDMARDILEYTDYEEIRTMAQNIIDVQEKEIAQMEKILNDQQESQPE